MGIIDSSSFRAASKVGAQSSVNEGHEPASGEVAGETAVLADGEFSLTDSAEEISLHMADRAEAKHHTERKVRSEPRPTVIASEAIQAYMAQTHDGDAHAKLMELARHLLVGRADPRQLVSQYFKDAPRQYLALQYALRQGEAGQANPDALTAISDAVAEIELERGAEVRAALNTISAASGFAADLDGVLAYQHTYRDIVLGESTLGKTFSLALEQFGGRKIADGLQSLLQALGQDLAATNSSTSPTRLEALVKDIYLLTVALTVLERCQELCAKLNNTTPSELSAQEEKLMRDMVDISAEPWSVTESRFSALATKHGAIVLDARIQFLKGVSSILKDLPVAIYVDAEVREAVLVAALAALTAASEEEEI